MLESNRKGFVLCRWVYYHIIIQQVHNDVVIIMVIKVESEDTVFEWFL